eukprot:543793-Pyramimonas_sp.AAC.1
MLLTVSCFANRRQPQAVAVWLAFCWLLLLARPGREPVDNSGLSRAFLNGVRGVRNAKRHHLIEYGSAQVASLMRSTTAPTSSPPRRKRVERPRL